MRTKRFPNRVDVRLSDETKASLEADAAARRMLLADLIRERLDLAQSVSQMVSALREDIAYRIGRSDKPSKPGAPNSPNDPMLLEMLLLLRTIAGPQRQTIVAAELALHDQSPWTPSEKK